MIQPIIDSSGVIHIFKGKQAEPIKLVVGEILAAEIMDIFPTGTMQLKINNRIINAQPQRELPLNKGDTVMVKVEKPLEEGIIPLRVLSASEAKEVQKAMIQAETEISDQIFKLIESLFSNNPNSIKETKQQMDIIKTIFSFPTEKLSETQKTVLMNKIIDVIFSQQDTSENLHELIKLLEQNDFPKEQISQLKNLIITTHEEITPEKLKQTLLNSGVSFEAKMKQALFDSVKIEQIKEDLKVILNQIIKEAKSQSIEEVALKAEQLLRQIDGYQILSKTYQSFFTFLPLLWQDIEGGNIAYKSFKREGKEYHTVFVTLNFKEEYLSFIVTMINKSFFISFSGQPEILSCLKDKEAILRERFQDKGMLLSGINYVSKTEELIKQWNIKEGSVSLTV
ncbi:hypothetical protein [Thermodesulfovibrio yellowstonii]|uniref:Flagellar hook-length control protein-like C-terminal domain-containing protein n=1 Tax=Thermodesulfovibrio yellowstonii (strain ATCC 51303 / DSM 11347 / YP87) TaxID=289376 RepID=B5YGU3_THEYD|nr:hypothetical protein [Thermodesulfovibrio yellowstonii]ACI21920.1 hypothetical protein THEYE_A0019 [Thermodesulfovibrio yellowstonii DSM 11347]MDI6865396.1 hypothetical protein [Thermodesulfovibrio yellowstonii]